MTEVSGAGLYPHPLERVVMALVFQGLYIFSRQDTHQFLYDEERYSPSFSCDLHIPYDLHLLVKIDIRLPQDV